MTENTPDAVKVAREAVAELCGALKPDVLAGKKDNDPPMLAARAAAQAMQAAMSPPAGVRVRALDLATLLKHAFDSGAKGGAWVDYDCTNLAPYHRVAEACGVPAEYYAAIEDAGAREGANPLPPDPTPAGAGDLVERLRDASDDPYFQMTPGVEDWLKKNWALREVAASRIEALQAEVAAQKSRADDMHRRAQQAEAPKMAARDVAKVMWGFISKAHVRYYQQRDRATSAEAERDALKAEVERGDVQRVRDLTKHIERADKAEEERDAWRERESETQEALQKIGEEFGVHGGEARTDGVRRILNKYRDALTEIAGAYTAHGYSDAMDAVQALKDTARDALK